MSLFAIGARYNRVLLKSTLFLTLLSFSFAADAELTAMHNAELSEVVGRSLIELDEYSFNNFNFVKLKLKGDMFVNANIDKVVLGAYEREGRNKLGCGTNWPLTCAPPSGEDYQYVSRYNTPFAPAGGVPGGADIEIHGLSLGYVVGNTPIPVVMSNPYLEFVFDGVGADREFVGLRAGADYTTGYMGLKGKGYKGTKQITGIIQGSMFDAGIANFTAINVRSKLRLEDPWTLAGLGLLQDGYESFHAMQLTNVADLFVSFQTKPVKYLGVDGPIGQKGLPGWWANIQAGENGVVNLDFKDATPYRPNKI